LSNIGNSGSARVVKVVNQLLDREHAQEKTVKVGNLFRNGNTDRISNAQLIDSHLHQPFADGDHLSRLYAALVRALESSADVAANKTVWLRCSELLDHHPEPLQGLINGHVDVFLREGLTRGSEEGNALDPDRQRTLQTCAVWYQRRIERSGRQLGPEFGSIPELGNPLR